MCVYIYIYVLCVRVFVFQKKSLAYQQYQQQQQQQQQQQLNSSRPSGHCHSTLMIEQCANFQSMSVNLNAIIFRFRPFISSTPT